MEAPKPITTGPILHPTPIPQTPTNISGPSTLAQNHDVKPGKDGISKVTAAIGSAIKGAFKTLSKLKVEPRTPPPDSTRASNKPFKSLGHAKAAFVHLCKEQMEVHDQTATSGIRQNKKSKTLSDKITPQQKTNLYHYTDEGSKVGFHVMNGMIRANLDPSAFAQNRLDTVKKDTLATFDIDKMEARLPKDADKKAFRNFAENFIMCTMAQNAVSVREGMAKLPLHQGITDRGMKDFPGKVDKLKGMLSTPGKIDFAMEAAFASSTTKAQTPTEIKKSDINHAKFSNDITLLSICRSGRDVQGISASPQEAEVLYPSDARFEIFGHKELQAEDGSNATKNIFFQVELSSEDHAAFNELDGLKKKMDSDPSYKPNASEKQALTHARDFNTYVKTQMGEFSKLGWDGDLAPPLPNTCKFFDQVITEAGKR